MLQQLTGLARGFLGEELSPEEEERLALFCAVVLSDWTARLLPHYQAEDCQDALLPAAALTALCSFLTVRNAVEPPLSFAAGDVSLRCGEDGRHQTVVQLKERAQEWMRPYVVDEGFAFRGVRG